MHAQYPALLFLALLPWDMGSNESGAVFHITWLAISTNNPLARNLIVHHHQWCFKHLLGFHACYADVLPLRHVPSILKNNFWNPSVVTLNYHFVARQALTLWYICLSFHRGWNCWRKFLYAFVIKPALFTFTLHSKKCQLCVILLYSYLF